MDKTKVEIAVGAFVALGIAALLMLSMKVSNLGSFTGGDGYNLIVHFENIGGLKVRAPVMMAGVRVGEVAAIDLDIETFEAKVTLMVANKFRILPKDTTASIFTSGLLGEQYVSLEPGGDIKVLQDGDAIKLSQSAMVLEQVLGQFLFSKAAGNE